MIRFAFKRLADQEPLVDGSGSTAPEPDYDGEEWIGWETRLTDERAQEVIAIKKEESPAAREGSIADSTSTDVTYIKVEDDD